MPPSIDSCNLLCYKFFMKNPYFSSLQNTPEINFVGPLPLKAPLLNEDIGRPTIFIDGGVKHLSSHPFHNPFNFSLGDGDSKEETVPSLDVKLSRQKDISDTGFALKGLPLSVQRLHLFGFLGGRLDHQICLFSLLQNWCSEDDRRQWSLEDRVLGFGKGRHKIYLSGVFSLFSFHPCRIQITGSCQYPLREARELAPFSDLSLSNVGLGEVDIDHSTPILLFLNEPFELEY